MSINNIDLSRILSLIIGFLTEPYDKFVEKLQNQGRVTDEEIRELRQALNEQVPRVSEFIRSHTKRASTEQPESGGSE